jgi:hypothetical protein
VKLSGSPCPARSAGQACLSYSFGDIEMTMLNTMRVLSGMSPEFSGSARRRPKLHEGRHALTLARFIQKPKLGRPTFFSLGDKCQLKFKFYKL